METLEFFCGTKSFSNIARALGHNTFTIDNNLIFSPDYLYDLRLGLNEYLREKILKSNLIWMSPPCTAFSIASRNKHFTYDHKPKTQIGKDGLKLLNICIEIKNICIQNNIIYFIENPMGRMRWFMTFNDFKHIWYCQYGDTRAKPTDLWTNLNTFIPKQCKNNNPLCNHIRAPRSSKTGTQGLENNIERGKIPKDLFINIFNKMVI